MIIIINNIFKNTLLSKKYSAEKSENFKSEIFDNDEIKKKCGLTPNEEFNFDLQEFLLTCFKNYCLDNHDTDDIKEILLKTDFMKKAINYYTTGEEIVLQNKEKVIGYCSLVLDDMLEESVKELRPRPYAEYTLTKAYFNNCDIINKSIYKREKDFTLTSKKGIDLGETTAYIFDPHILSDVETSIDRLSKDGLGVFDAATTFMMYSEYVTEMQLWTAWTGIVPKNGKLTENQRKQIDEALFEIKSHLAAEFDSDVIIPISNKSYGGCEISGTKTIKANTPVNVFDYIEIAIKKKNGEISKGYLITDNLLFYYAKAKNQILSYPIDAKKIYKLDTEGNLTPNLVSATEQQRAINEFIIRHVFTKFKKKKKVISIESLEEFLQIKKNAVYEKHHKSRLVKAVITVMENFKRREYIKQYFVEKLKKNGKIETKIIYK